MSPSISEILNAVRLSEKFAQLFQGGTLSGVSGSKPRLKVTECARSMRGPGYRFNKFSFVVRVDSDAGPAYGHGESDVEMLAVQKGIAEAIERSAFYHMFEHDPLISTSNGWAAHLSKERAQSSARTELLERDAVLVHWFSQTPMQKVNPAGLPRRLSAWICQELPLAPGFNQIKIFTTSLGEVPVASVLIHDSRSYGFVSHASGHTFESCIDRAVSEACRLADLHEKGLLEAVSSKGVQTPDDHALYYAETENLPSWFFEGESISFGEANRAWKKKIMNGSRITDFQFKDFQCGPLFVAQCTSPLVQGLFFGESLKALNSGKLNLQRIKSLTGVEKIFLQPHCVA